MTCILVITERDSRNKFQRNSIKKKKHFLELSLHFWNLETFRILKKKMLLMTLIFPKLLIPKNVVTWMSESCYFRRPFASKHVKESQTLLMSAWQHFYGKFPFMSKKVRCISSLLFGSKIWRVSFTTCTSNDMYSCHKKREIPPTSCDAINFKPKNIFCNFCCIFWICIRFLAFWKQRWSW